MDSCFFCDISQVLQIFSGPTSNSVINQIQNEQLQEILSPNSNLLQLPFFTSKDFQQLHSVIVPNIPEKILNTHGFNAIFFPSDLFFSHMNIDCYNSILTFLTPFSQKITFFPTNESPQAKSTLSQLRKLSTINPKKLFQSSSTTSSGFSSSSFETESIYRITLASFLSFICTNLQTNANNPTSNQTDEGTAKYEYNIDHYALLFHLIILSFQIPPFKQQALDSLITAFRILFQSFVYESYQIYKIANPQSNGVSYKISRNNSEKCFDEIVDNFDDKILFNDETFSLILEKIQTLIISNASILFPLIDKLFISIICMIGLDKKTQLTQFDVYIMKFITVVATKTHQSTFSKDTIHQLILHTSNHLLKYNKISLDLFISLSKHNDDASNSEVIEMIVRTLLFEIPKEKPIDLNATIVRLNKNEKNSQLTNQLSHSDNFFNEGFKQSEINQKLNLKEHFEINTNSYQSLVAERIYDIIQVLTESFHLSSAMLDKLYVSIGKTTQQNPKQLFDGFCLFIVFYLEANTKWHFDPSKAHNPAIFLSLSHLFSKFILTTPYKAPNLLRKFVIGILIDTNERELLKIFNMIESSYDNEIINDDSNIPASPLFVLEMIETLIFNYKKLMILLTNNSGSIIQPLCSTMNHLLRISNTNDSYPKIIEVNNHYSSFKSDVDRSRYAFLVLIQMLFENNEVKKILIDNPSFTKTYFDFIFEGEDVRKYILKQIQSALIETKCSLASAFIPTISQTIKSIIENSSKNVDESIQLIKEVSLMMNEVLAKRQDHCKSFSLFHPILIDIISFINQLNETKLEPLFKESVELMARLTFYIHVNDSDIKLFINTIHQIYDQNEFPHWLYESLIKLMVINGTNIKHPSVLQLIFEFYNNDEYLTFLCQLMDNNISNAKKATSVGFDEVVFNYLMSDPLHFSESTLIKDLFTKISLTSISKSVIYKFIEYLSPKNGRFLNKHSDLYINYLSDLFSLSLETQHESLHLNPGQEQVPVTIDTNSSNKSNDNLMFYYGDGYFTVVFWLLIEEMSPTYYPCIFSVIDEKGNIYEVFVRMRKICLNYDNTHKKTSLVFNQTLAINQWHFISLTFSKQEEKYDDSENDNKLSSYCITSMSLNGKTDILYTVKFPASRMITGNAAFTFGGVLHDNSIKSTQPCCLGPYAIFNRILGNDKIMNLFKQEQRFFCRDKKDETLRHVYQPYMYGPRQNQKSFASTIVLDIKLEVFIPLFLLVPLKFEDGTEFHNFIEIVLRILKHGLNFGSIVEESFALANGFGIISFILSLDKYHKYCDYNLYQQFYSLFKNLMNEKLKISIITSILINFDLWATIENDDEKIQIFDHWLYSIFPTNIHLITQHYTFSDLLNKIIYYFHSEEDKRMIKYKYKLPQIANSFCSKNSVFEYDDQNSIENINESKISNEKFKTVLDILFQCLLVAVDTMPTFVTFSDYSLLVSYLFTSNSVDLITNLSKLLTQMIISGETPSMCSILENNTAIPRIHQIFTSSSNISSIKSTLEIIISLHTTKIIYKNKLFMHIFADYYNSLNNGNTPNSNQQSQCTLTDHIYIILRQIPREIFGKPECFKSLAKLMEQGKTSVFLLLCWSALCLIDDNREYINPDFENEKKDYLNTILRNIEPSHNYVHPNWELIPIILIIQAKDNHFANAMIRFLLNCCQGNEWKSLYGSLSLISSIFQVSSYKYHRIYIKCILNDIIQKKNENGVDDLLVALVANYLFYREPRYFNISKFFESSPFKDYKKEITEDETMTTIEKFTTFFDLIKLINNDRSLYGQTINVFGLRLNRSAGKWIDRDIAKLFLQYLTQFSKHETYQKLRFLLISFLLNQNDDPTILNYIKDLDKPQITTLFNSSNSIVSGIKNQECYQMLVDLLCTQLERNGLQDNPIFELRSKNFQENSQNFLKSVEYTFDFKSIYDSIISTSFSFMTKIESASNKLIKCTQLQPFQLPNIFLIDINQQQVSCPKELHPFIDRSYLSPPDTVTFYANSQRQTVIKTINDMYLFKRSFKQLFESLTTKGAPFHSLLELTLSHNDRLHLKRDKTLIAQSIPLRMKTNWSFNNHQMISETNEKSDSIINLPPHSIKKRKTQPLKRFPSYGLFNDVPFAQAPSKPNTTKKPQSKLNESTCVVLHVSNESFNNCALVQIDKIDDVRFSLLTTGFQMVKHKNLKQITVLYSDIKYMNKTTFYHKQVSIQVITNIGTEYFLTFKTEDIRDAIFNVIHPLIRNASSGFHKTLENSIQYWIDNKLTNFEYLLKLNMASGRSFQNPSQYPLFPIVLCEYNNSIKLDESSVFRDFSKPSGALNEKKFEILKKNQESLLKLGSNTKAFLFSSYASNPQIIFGELARIEPFTSLFISLSGGKLEEKERFGLLTSISLLFNNVLNDQMDFREFSPEFYWISSEFLKKPTDDSEVNLKLGDVVIPEYSANQIEFLYLHRKALESKIVRNNLNNWIDLIFGCLQRNPNNNYDPALYSDIWKTLEEEEAKQMIIDKSSTEKQNLKQRSKSVAISLNPIERKIIDLIVKDLTPNPNDLSSSIYTRIKEVEASKRILGQVPLQLFGRPHKHPQLANLMRRRKTIITNEKITTPRKPAISPIPLKVSSSVNKLSGSQMQLPSKIDLKQPTASKLTLSGDDFSKDDFEVSFPQKNLVSNELKEMRDNIFGIRKIDLKRDKLSFAAISHESKLLEIHLIDENGNRFLISIDTLSNDIVDTKSFNEELSKLKIHFSKKNIALVNSSLVVNTDKGIVLLSQDPKQNPSRSNFEIQKNSIDTFIKKFALIESDSRSLVLIGNDSIISIFDGKLINWNQISNGSVHSFSNRRLHFFNQSKISCGAVSSKMNTLAVAATNGIVLLYSLFNGSTVIPIELPKNFVAKSIVITQSLGLVVIDSIYSFELPNNGENNHKIHMFYVFTINGEFVRRRAISLNDDDDVLQLISFPSKKGIDYIAFVTKFGFAFHVCEAFLLDFENFVSPSEVQNDFNSVDINQMNDEELIEYQIKLPFPTLMNFYSEPICLEFNKQLGSILYIAKNGDLGFIPIDKLIKENF